MGTFDPFSDRFFCLAWPILVHQVTMYPPQVTHQCRSDHDHTHAVLAAYRHFTIAKGMFDRPNRGFYSSTKVPTAGTSPCTSLTTQSQVYLVL